MQGEGGRRIRRQQAQPVADGEPLAGLGNQNAMLGAVGERFRLAAEQARIAEVAADGLLAAVVDDAIGCGRTGHAGGDRQRAVERILAPQREAVVRDEDANGIGQHLGASFRRDGDQGTQNADVRATGGREDFGFGHATNRQADDVRNGELAQGDGWRLVDPRLGSHRAGRFGVGQVRVQLDDLHQQCWRVEFFHRRADGLFNWPLHDALPSLAVGTRSKCSLWRREANRVALGTRR